MEGGLMLRWLRPFMAKVWRAPAKGLLRLGITPNAVTVFGTVGAVAAALWFFPKGGFNLFTGTLVIALFAFTDMLDGTMARLSGKASRFGAFLDSTLDRVADAAIFGSLAWGFIDVDRQTALAAFVCLAVGSFVPYARARAEGLGIDAKVGIAERADRLVIGGIAAVLVGLGLPLAILTYTLWALVLAAAITVVQRGAVVARANRKDPTLPAPAAQRTAS
jgi:CDP-diacylglycerol--glycerol-3-phosphate 3-phosphatidyltransferase